MRGVNVGVTPIIHLHNTNKGVTPFWHLLI